MGLLSGKWFDIVLVTDKVKGDNKYTLVIAFFTWLCPFYYYSSFDYRYVTSIYFVYKHVHVRWNLYYLLNHVCVWKGDIVALVLFSSFTNACCTPHSHRLINNIRTLLTMLSRLCFGLTLMWSYWKGGFNLKYIQLVYVLVSELNHIFHKS